MTSSFSGLTLALRLRRGDVTTLDDDDDLPAPPPAAARLFPDDVALTSLYAAADDETR